MNINISSYNAIICDLDGTLYDKRNIVRYLLIGERYRLNFLASERKARAKLKGKWFGTQEAFYNAYFKEMANEYLLSEEAARTWYFSNYMPLMAEVLKKHYTHREWVPQLITDCHNNNIPIVVYSDYDFVEEKLRAIDLNPADFDLVIAASELGGLKPCREAAQKLIDRLSKIFESKEKPIAGEPPALIHLEPNNILFIGDRDDTDGKSAEAVGAKFYKV